MLPVAVLIGLSGCAANATPRQREARLDAALFEASAHELDRVRAVLAADLSEQDRKDAEIARLTRDLRTLQARLDALQAEQTATATVRE